MTVNHGEAHLRRYVDCNKKEEQAYFFNEARGGSPVRIMRELISLVNNNVSKEANSNKPPIKARFMQA